MSTVIVGETHPAPRVPPFPIYQISVHKYHEMIQKGIFTEDEPVELLEGWLVPKMPRDPAHDTAIGLAESALRPLLPSGWRIRVQSAITTGDSEPEPDVAVVKGELRAFIARHPSSGDIGLLVEVASSSLVTDRIDKGRIYARASIPVYWLINLVDRRVEVYCDPESQANPPTYRRCQTYVSGQMAPLELPGHTAQVAVQDLLP